MKKKPRILVLCDAIEPTPPDHDLAVYLARELDRIHAALADPDTAEASARRTVERIALALTAALLLQHAPTEVADAFCASRIDHDAGAAFGTQGAATPFDAILARAWPF